MGKYTSKEKTRKKRLQEIGKFLVVGVIVLVGAVVISLLNLPDDPYNSQVEYGIGVIVIFLLAEAGTLLYKTIRKK